LQKRGGKKGPIFPGGKGVTPFSVNMLRKEGKGVYLAGGAAMVPSVFMEKEKSGDLLTMSS